MPPHVDMGDSADAFAAIDSERNRHIQAVKAIQIVN